MQFTYAKIVKLCQGIQMLQAKTSVGTTLVGPPWHPVHRVQKKVIYLFLHVFLTVLGQIFMKHSVNIRNCDPQH